jgi:hypothetical protein
VSLELAADRHRFRAVHVRQPLSVVSLLLGRRTPARRCFRLGA